MRRGGRPRKLEEKKVEGPCRQHIRFLETRSSEERLRPRTRKDIARGGGVGNLLHSSDGDGELEWERTPKKKGL